MHVIVFIASLYDVYVNVSLVFIEFIYLTYFHKCTYIQKTIFCCLYLLDPNRSMALQSGKKIVPLWIKYDNTLQFLNPKVRFIILKI